MWSTDTAPRRLLGTLTLSLGDLFSFNLSGAHTGTWHGITHTTVTAIIQPKVFFPPALQCVRLPFSAEIISIEGFFFGL
jgi:hypothetical protein